MPRTYGKGYDTRVSFDKAARLTLADMIQYIDPVAATALRQGIGLTIHVRAKDAPKAGGLISRVRPVEEPKPLTVTQNPGVEAPAAQA